jgi:hypothetical protein
VFGWALAAVLGLACALAAGDLAAVAPSAQAAGLTPGTTAIRAAQEFISARGERGAVAVLDRSTGRMYAAGDVRSYYYSASVAKVFIADQLAVTGQLNNPRKRALAYSMITRSDNNAAYALYPYVGGDSVVATVSARYRLGDLIAAPANKGQWDTTKITALGLVDFYDRMAHDARVAPWLLDAMAHTTRTDPQGDFQLFGLPAVAASWRVKQGWACCYGPSIISFFNTTGLINDDRYAVAILTQGDHAAWYRYGEDTVTRAARRLLPDGAFPGLKD